MIVVGTKRSLIPIMIADPFAMLMFKENEGQWSWHSVETRVDLAPRFKAFVLMTDTVTYL